MSSNEGIKLSDEILLECTTQVLIKKWTKHGGRVLVCNRGLGDLILPTKIMGNREAKVGRYKDSSSEWMILSMSLTEDKDYGHTNMIYQAESDLEGDACSFTLQWKVDIPVSLFTNDKRQLKLISATFSDEDLKEWGEYLPCRRSPSAVRIKDNIVQLWIPL
jgi:hypothetical protein